MYNFLYIFNLISIPAGALWFYVFFFYMTQGSYLFNILISVVCYLYATEKRMCARQFTVKPYYVNG